MIDLHSHILPAIDDGSADLAMSLDMARIAVEDGVQCMACTPHIVPGLWENNTQIIESRVELLRTALYEKDIDLELYVGADVRIDPDLPKTLGTDRVPTLNGTRYFLFEPTHQVLSPGIEALATRLVMAGFIPILTHPERLQWLPSHYDTVERLIAIGCLVQLTAGSVTGAFGKSAQYYSERFLDEGRVDILASDTHNTSTRSPLLSVARDAVAKRLGEEQAMQMVAFTPADILNDIALPPRGLNVSREPLAAKSTPEMRNEGWFRRLTKGFVK
jgi:protein-tyrosine phosphatase